MSKVMGRIDYLTKIGNDGRVAALIAGAEQLERIADALEKQNAGNLVVKVDSEPVCQASSDEMESMSTSKLVEELKKRDGVSAITADPYEEYTVSTSQCGFRDTGPAVILVIRD